MPQSFAQIYLHIVFSTKTRQRFLIADQLREQLHAYIVGICKNQDSPTIIVGGTENTEAGLRIPDDVTRESVFPKGKRTRSPEISIGYSKPCSFALLF